MDKLHDENSSSMDKLHDENSSSFPCSFPQRLKVTALKIVDLIHETPEEVVQIPDAPSRDSPTHEWQPSFMHNDAVTFSHACEKLGLEYTGRFFKQKPIEEDEMGPIMEQFLVFVDTVPIFRELAIECLGDMLDFQKKKNGRADSALSQILCQELNKQRISLCTNGPRRKLP